MAILGVGKRPAKVFVHDMELGPERWAYTEGKSTLLLKDLTEYFPRGAWSSAWRITWR